MADIEQQIEVGIPHLTQIGQGAAMVGSAVCGKCSMAMRTPSACAWSAMRTIDSRITGQRFLAAILAWHDIGNV